MKRTVLLALLSLHCSSLTSCASRCHENGPRDCSLYTFCSWTPGNHFKLYKDEYLYFAGLSRESEEGKLISRNACSTQGEEHCLQFKYGFEQNNVIDLSVRVRYETDQAELLMWIMSSSDGWDNAAVPVNTSEQFNIVFEAKRRSEYLSSNRTVLIDYIEYSKSPCPKGLLPTNAHPTTTITRIAPIKTTATSRITSPASTDPTPILTTATSVTTGITKMSSFIPFSTTSESANTTEAVTMPTSPDNFEEKQSEEASNVGITVGVTVAVLIFVVIVITVLLVVFKRKHVQFWKACCRKKQQKEQFHMNASHNGAYSLDTDEPTHPNGAVSNHTQQQSDNHCLDARTSTHSSNYYCYENTQPNNPSEPVYTKVNKPRKVLQETPPGNQRKPNSPVYEMCNEEAANSYDAAGTEYQNLPPTMAKQEQDEQKNSSSPLPTLPSGYNLTQPPNSSSVYHILEKEPGTDRNSVHHVPNASMPVTAQGHDGEYNKLDFDTKSYGETKNCDEEKTEKAPGGVYSMLNEGDGDLYNEVHRVKRDDVIDGVYSHIQ